ncbi:membrane hypothetical protein [Vibrio chagasii]|nr:membrane hypothetical protein [Vibrio chagasii]
MGLLLFLLIMCYVFLIFADDTFRDSKLKSVFCSQASFFAVVLVAVALVFASGITQVWQYENLMVEIIDNGSPYSFVELLPYLGVSVLNNAPLTFIVIMGLVGGIVLWEFGKGVGIHMFNVVTIACSMGVLVVDSQIKAPESLAFYKLDVTPKSEFVDHIVQSCPKHTVVSFDVGGTALDDGLSFSYNCGVSVIGLKQPSTVLITRSDAMRYELVKFGDDWRQKDSDLRWDNFVELGLLFDGFYNNWSGGQDARDLMFFASYKLVITDEPFILFNVNDSMIPPPFARKMVESGVDELMDQVTFNLDEKMTRFDKSVNPASDWDSAVAW